MKHYLLDTNICIYYVKGKFNLDKKIKSVKSSNCYISEITVAELKFGVESSKYKHENSIVLDGILKEFQVLPIFSSLDIYAQEKAKLKREGLIIDDFDLLIGATAIKNNMILVTNNTSHFERLKGIRLENWTV